MNRYALIKNGSVDLIVEQDDTPVLPGTWVEVTGMNVGPLDLYDGVAFTKYVPPPAQEIITKAAMISRFTPQEYVGIISATKTDVEVQAWYDLFQAATVVNLSDPKIIAGIELLASKGLLTKARASEILTAPAQIDEKP